MADRSPAGTPSPPKLAQTQKPRGTSDLGQLLPGDPGGYAACCTAQTADPRGTLRWAEPKPLSPAGHRVWTKPDRPSPAVRPNLPSPNR